MALNIMVLESDHGAADDAIGELTDAGHVVLCCHEPNAPAFPCRGIADTASCPLESHVVDVALTVRPSPRSQPAPHEDGVHCALMHRVPLVVAGPVVLNPYAEVATSTLDRSWDVVAACEAAASAELTEHARHAVAAVAATVGSDRAAATRVSVTRHSGTLRVRVNGLPGITHQERQAAVVRVVGTLRRFDRAAPKIDVAINDTPV